MVLEEISKQVTEYRDSIVEKIKQTGEELERIKNDRKLGVENKCQILEYQIVEIAFVLEEEAKAISAHEKQNISELEATTYLTTK